MDYFQNGSFFVIETNDENNNYLSLRIPISKDIHNLSILDELNKCQSELNSRGLSSSEEETISSEISKRDEITKPDTLQTRGSTNPVGNNDNTSTPTSIYSPEAQKLLDQTHKNMMTLTSCK